MQREKWNEGWTILKPGESPLMAAMMGGGQAQTITLPHDAMIHEERTQTTKNQHQTGFYPGGCYTYIKSFEAPEEWQNKTVLIEFEGVYQNARVFINGDYAGGHPFGYTEFAVCVDDFLHYGQVNTVTVIANNSAEENSRWYSGSGIYRDVHILVGNEVHIARNSLKISTPEIDDLSAVVQIELTAENLGRKKHKLSLEITITGPDGEIAGRTGMPVSVFGSDAEPVRTRIEVNAPRLWSPDSPDLYTLKTVLKDGEDVLDEETERFGIRSLSLSSSRGLRINGKETKLRGACIHHDNGVIGAVTLARAEERRVEKLKEAGFNAIRASHHPMSRAMLDACDRLGMLILDELSDCWTRSKNNNDYAEKFPYFWREDVRSLVDKDFNHPSVIMYISGNEIQEAATPKGAQLNRQITKEFHCLDGTRYVTAAINGLLSCMDHMGEILCDITGMTMEQMMAMQAQSAEAPASDAGADAANGSTDLMKGPMADAFAANHIVTELLDEFASVTDVTGYNYLTARHGMEHELFPNRVILGTETLPSDIVRLWSTVKNNTHVIGDMTWTGWDYIGEAGSGVTYYDGRQGFMPNWPISLAWMGDIDIIGNRRPISYIREIVFGLRKKPFIAVEPLNHYGERANQSAWPWKDETISWTWEGYEGKPAVVNVYSDAEEIELFLNGRCLGRKPAGEENGFLASWEVPYEPGELRAAAIRKGAVSEEDFLRTAGAEAGLCVEVDRRVLSADGADLAYVMISLRDANGVLNPQLVREVTVSVEGPGTLQGMGSADYATDNRYDNNVWKTWQGCLLAVVRAGVSTGDILVRVSSGEEMKEVVITVK